MMAILSNMLRDPDSIEDALGAVGMIVLLCMGCFAGEGMGWWGPQ